MSSIAKKFIVSGLALALAIAFAMTAGAAPKKTEKSKFYDFNVVVIKGEISKPTISLFGVRDQIRFEPLLRLKRSFKEQFRNAHMHPTLR